MTNYNLSRIYLSKDGNYKDINGNIIAKKGDALKGSAWKQLAAQYGSNYANHFSMNTRNGNIFENGKWRLNNDASQRNDKATSLTRKNGALMQKNQFTGKMEYIDWNTQKKSIWKPNKVTKQAENQNNQEDEENNIAVTLAKKLGAKGLMGDAIGLAAYFTPAGNALSAINAFNALRKGNYGDAAMNTLFAIPVLGQFGRIAKVGLKAGKMIKAANKVDKAINAVDNVSKWSNRGLWATQAYQIPSGVVGVKSSYNELAKAKKQAQDQTKDFNELKNLGYSDDQIKTMVGDDTYNQYKLLTARDNSFLGNIGTIYDLAKYKTSSEN